MIGGIKLTDEVLKKLYNDDIYLDYLRRHPKWYYYLDIDSKHFSDFERALKKDLKKTTYDKLESIKNQINFASAFVQYFSK